MVLFKGTHTHLATTAIAVISLGVIALPTTAAADHSGDVEVVKLRDNCDPATFNAAIGPGACAAHGSRRTVTFAQFLAKLNPTDFGHPQWENDPDELDINTGDAIKAVVRGGEFHTFTEVEVFGPGCVAPINAALGLTVNPPTPAQCANYFATTGVPVGGTLTVANLSPGTHLFMCEIHPWMRTTVTVENDD
jgi:plastocyanin